MSTLLVKPSMYKCKLYLWQDTKKATAQNNVQLLFFYCRSVYRFMLIRVSSISSETVMILELDWKPRCVIIMSEN